MEFEAFLKQFADQFDDTDPSEITADTDYQSLDEWCSLTALGVIAFVKTEYNVQVTGQEIRSCSTVKELYDLVSAKL
jgi:acyl carrier protein